MTREIWNAVLLGIV